MAVGERLFTADDLLAMGDEATLWELDGGRLVKVSPSGDQAAVLAMWLGHLLLSFVEPHNLGLVTGPDGGYRLSADPDTVRVPDVGFIRKARVPALTGKFFALAPDFAIEVVSPGNTADELRIKIDQFFAAGTHLIWLVYPKARVVEVYTPDGRMRAHKPGMTLDGGDVLPGFSLSVARVFERLTPDPSKPAEPIG